MARGTSTARRPARLRLRWVPAAVLLAAIALTTQALAGPADRDVGFAGKGVVTVDFGGTSDEPFAVAVQADGKIVVAGSRDSCCGGDPNYLDFALARFGSDGYLDASFGTGGRVVTDLRGSLDRARAVAVQADGKIVAAGSSGNPEQFALARYDVDGTLDTTFGVDGKVETAAGAWGRVEDLAAQGDGKIVAAGIIAGQFGLARFLSDGTLDRAFGEAGIVITTWAGGSFGASAVAVQGDGKIVVAGGAIASHEDFALARYDPDGRLDTSFGGDGTVLTDFGDSSDMANDLALQPDGKIVVAGRASHQRVGTSFGPSEGFAAARYNPDGSLDPSFGASGTATVAHTLGGIGDAQAVVLRPGGGLVLGGSVYRPGRTWEGSNFALVGLDGDGRLDASFSFDGLVEDDFGREDDLTALAVDGSGKIVAVGRSVANSRDFALVRYLPSGEVEAVPPETEIVTGPADGSVTSSTGGAFGFAGSDNVDAPAQLTFACSLDGSQFATCGTPAPYAGLADGAHRFAVQARDRAGNVDPSPATRTWTVDTTPPETALTETPPSLGRSRAARFSFDASDASGPALTFECALDAGSPAACTSPHEIAGLRDGTHTFRVRAVDRAGNQDATWAENRWVVDATAPQKPTVGGPRMTQSRRPTYRFFSRDALTPASELEFHCALDSRRLHGCPRVIHPRLRPGRHVLRVAVLDEARNTSVVARVAVTVRERDR